MELYTPKVVTPDLRLKITFGKSKGVVFSRPHVWNCWVVTKNHRGQPRKENIIWNYCEHISKTALFDYYVTIQFSFGLKEPHQIYFQLLSRDRQELKFQQKEYSLSMYAINYGLIYREKL